MKNENVQLLWKLAYTYSIQSSVLPIVFDANSLYRISAGDADIFFFQIIKNEFLKIHRQERENLDQINNKYSNMSLTRSMEKYDHWTSTICYICVHCPLD